MDRSNPSRSAWLCRAACIAGLASASNARADGLQPLAAFVASARRNNPDDREADAIVAQRQAQASASRASLLPSVSAQGTYTRNQFASAFDFEGQEVVLQRQDSFDANIALAIPLINVNAWAQARAARLTTAVSEAQRLATATSIEQSVTQAYYQLLGAEAVVFVAHQNLEVFQHNLKTVRDRAQLGTASELDLQRAIASVAGAEQDQATADQNVIVARRSLESLTRLPPEPATPADYVIDDLHEEAPIAQWLRGTGALVAAEPSIAATRQADASRDVALASWLPTLSAQAAEHLTDASGFTGKTGSYTITVTASWRLDFGLLPNVRAQTAAVAAAKAREDKAARAVEDAVYQAWHQVHLGIVKVRAARAQVQAAALALNSARDRYASGVATQLEVVQAQHDLFSAGVSAAQADFDLQYARALLRLASRRT